MYGSPSKISPSSPTPLMTNNHNTGRGGGGRPRLGNPPVVGKHYPTGRVATLMSKYPSILTLVSFAPLFILTILIAVEYPQTEVTQRDFLLSRFAPVDNENTVADMVSYWKAMMSLINVTDGQKCYNRVDLHRNDPVYRIEVRGVFDPSKLSSKFDYNKSLLTPPATRISNVLGNRSIHLLQKLEQKIATLDEFRTICYTSNCKNNIYNDGVAPRCAPMSSLSTYFFPGGIHYLKQEYSPPLASNVIVPVYYDNGEGDAAESTSLYNQVVNRMMTNPDALWYVDPGFTKKDPSATAIRFQAVLGAPVILENGQRSTRMQFVYRARAIALKLAEFIDELNNDPTNVNMHFSSGGEIMEGALLSDALASEWYFLLTAIIIIVVITAIRTWSVFLTATIAIGLTLTYTASLGLYSSATGNMIPFLSTTSIFLTTGLALHVSLTLQDCFKASGAMSTTGRTNDLDVPQRISYTFRHACRSNSLTLLITIIMFAGCLITPFQGVQDFARLLMVQLALLFYLSWTYFIGVIILYHWYFSNNDRLIQRQRDRINQSANGVMESQGRRHPILRNYLEDQEANTDAGEAIYSSDMRSFAEHQKSRRRNVANTRSLVKVIHTIMSQVGASQQGSVQLAGGDGGRGFTSVIGDIGGRKKKNRPVVEAFDESAFAEAEDIAQSRGGGRGNTDENETTNERRHGGDALRTHNNNRSIHYFSPRTVSINDMLHIPAKSIFEYQKDILAEVKADEQRHLESTGEQIYSSSSDSESDRPTASAAAGANYSSSSSSPLAFRRGRHCLKQNNWFVDFGEDRRAKKNNNNNSPAANKKSNTNTHSRGDSVNTSVGSGGSGNPLSPNRTASHEEISKRTIQSQIHLSKFISHWHEVANRIGIRQGKGKLAPIVAFAAQALVKSTDYAKVVAVAKQNNNGAPSSSINMISARNDNEQTRGLLSKMTQRWKQRSDKPRKFILFGKRVGETRAEKDARILAKVPNMNRVSWLEDKVGHLYVPFINKARWGCVGLTAALIIAFSVVASTVEYQDGIIQLVSKPLLTDYQATNKYFVETNPTCDACSAYFQRINQYHVATQSETAICGQKSQNVFVDECGVCMGNGSSCTRCINTYSNQSALALDMCGVCRVSSYGPAAGGPCECDSLTTCGLCEFLGKVPVLPGLFTGGASCTNQCSAANCEYCDPYSGTCLPSSCTNRGSRADGQCQCEPGLGYGGKWCHVESQCSNNGRVDASVSGSAMCMCLGNFGGAQCQFCMCKNGGVCHSDTGACICPAGYAGTYCEKCLSTCGTCHADWTAIEYSTTSCVAQFCTTGNLQSGTVCDECELSVSGLAATTDTQSSCWGRKGYYWSSNHSACYRERPATGPTGCQTCNGFWSGPNCQTCSMSDGRCLPDGSFVACDGNRYITTQFSKVPTIDKCGFCTTNRATSCNRPAPCVGEQCDDGLVSMLITIAPALDSSITANTQLLFNLRRFCQSLNTSLGINGTCLALDYPRNTVSGTELSTFALSSSSPEDMGFDPWGRLTYMRVRARVFAGTTSAEIDTYFSNVQRVVQDEAGDEMSIYVTADAWTLAKTNLSVGMSLKFTVFLGLSITLAAIFALTLSPRLTLVSVVCVGGSAACTLGFIVAVGWEFNALLVCCFPGIFAVPLCHISHMALHYMDRLEESQLQLFARESSTKEAVRTTLSRTLMTVLAACIASAIVCIPTVFSKVHAMYLVAVVMLIAHAWSLVFACVLFPGCLCALGPVMTARHIVLTICVAVVCFIIIGSIILSSTIGVGSSTIF